jgi:hypothetical protein
LKEATGERLLELWRILTVAAKAEVLDCERLTTTTGARWSVTKMEQRRIVDTYWYFLSADVVYSDCLVAMLYILTMTDKVTTLTINGKVGYEDEITPAQAAKIIAFLESGDDAAVSLGDGAVDQQADKGGGVKKVESAREALDVSGATKNPEKVVALAAYVMQDGGETFKVEDVKAAFRRARETAPGNFPRDLDKAITSGWVGDAGNGEYFLTAKVDGVLDGDFKFGNGATTRARSMPRKSPTAGKPAKAKNGKPDVFATIDIFPSTLEGFPAYSKMKQNKDKLLWVVKFAKDNGITGLANKDVEWITDHLGAGVPSKQISAAFMSAQKAGYANKSTQNGTVRITLDGETYLATVGSAAA